MARLIIRRRFPWRVMWLTALVCGLIAVIAFAGYGQLQRRVPIPSAVWKQVTFPVLLPQLPAVDGSSYKFDPDQKVLTFKSVMPDGQTVTFAEQATPAPFTDIPNYYTQFLQTLFDYQSFDTLQGTVHLTHPKGAGQAAVLSSKGTLIFARVSRDESQDVWRQVFNKMTIYQP